MTGRSAGGRKSGAEELDLFGEAAPPRPSAPQSPAYDRRRAGARRAEPLSIGEPLLPGSRPDSALTVATLVHIAKDLLEGAFTPVWVRGEVSDFKAHRNGHWYFCLRDELSQIRCVVWSRERRRMPAPLVDGMQVLALGQPTVYPARGDLQFVVAGLEAVGDGLRRKALEETHARLAEDGLLAAERKRALPRFPRRVAVVTSPDGAALRDIIAVIRRRCPIVEIVVAAARVQGDGAPLEIAAAIDRVSRWGGADTVIVGRGGGAHEDLWAFNDEGVARTLAACPVPTISAVGHEIDVTLCDLVADLRAPTPSAAAEAAVPVLADLRDQAAALRSALRLTLARRTEECRRHVEARAHTLGQAAARTAERKGARVATASARLGALSPLATLARGYAVARGADGATLSSAGAFAPGMPFDLLLRDGTVPAVVRERAGAPPTDAPPDTSNPASRVV